MKSLHQRPHSTNESCDGTNRYQLLLNYVGSGHGAKSLIDLRLKILGTSRHSPSSVCCHPLHSKGCDIMKTQKEFQLAKDR